MNRTEHNLTPAALTLTLALTSLGAAVLGSDTPSRDVAGYMGGVRVQVTQSHGMGYMAPL